MSKIIVVKKDQKIDVFDLDWVFHYSLHLVNKGIEQSDRKCLEDGIIAMFFYHFKIMNIKYLNEFFSDLNNSMKFIRKCMAFMKQKNMKLNFLLKKIKFYLQKYWIKSTNEKELIYFFRFFFGDFFSDQDEISILTCARKYGQDLQFDFEKESILRF